MTWSLNHYINETDRLIKCMPLIRERYIHTKYWPVIQSMVELGINPINRNGT